MASIARLPLFLLFVASCYAFQTPLVTQGGILALRSPKNLGNLETKVLATGDTQTEHAEVANTGTKKLIARRLQHELPLHDILLWDESEVRGRTWQQPLLLNKVAAIQPSALHPAMPTRALGALALVMGAVSLALAIPGAGKILANCAAGALGGIAALGVSPDVQGRLSEAVAAQGVLKAVSAGSYSTLIALVSTCSAGARTCGLANVAMASAGTGLIMGMCHSAFERANAAGGGASLMAKLRAKASEGLFTKDGLFGTATLDALVDSVVQYEAFFLSYSLLVAACPWMGLTLAGTAVSGALSGMASMAAGAALRCLTNASGAAQRCMEWWSGKQSLRCSGIVNDYSSAAAKSSVLFVVYKAAYDMLMAF